MLSLLLLPALLATAAATCPAGWHPYTSSCYYSSTYTASWREARTACTAMGGGSDLVAIQNEAENTFLTTSLKASDAWIGLNDLSHENTFVWADGSAAHYVNWADGQPNNLLDQDCVNFLDDGSGKWDDNHCVEKKDYICERPAM